jgi:transcriptional regulator with XRE-family HTH domain
MKFNPILMKKAREGAGKLQKDVEYIGIALRTYSAWERGENGEPRGSDLGKLADLFGVTVEAFYEPDPK